MAKHSGQDDFLSASLDLNYHFDGLALGVKSRYHNKTIQTPTVIVMHTKIFEILGRKFLISKIYNIILILYL